MHAHTQTRAFSILYHASVANLSRTFFPIAKYCCLQFWSLRGVLSAHWGHISSEKRFVSIHKDLQHACFLTLAGCVKCQNGNCDVGSFCLRKVSRVFLEKSDFCFVLGSFFFFFFFFIMLTTTNSHTTGWIRWESSRSAVPFSVKFNGFWVKWSVASAQAERCNQALNQAIGISSCSHQSHTKKKVNESSSSGRTDPHFSDRSSQYIIAITHNFEGGRWIEYSKG